MSMGMNAWERYEANKIQFAKKLALDAAMSESNSEVKD